MELRPGRRLTQVHGMVWLSVGIFHSDRHHPKAKVDRQGIRQITSEDIAQAKAAGKRWKQVCSARRTEQGIQAKVAPELEGFQ
jgi:homoserine dehydrogenase